MGLSDVVLRWQRRRQAGSPVARRAAMKRLSSDGRLARPPDKSLGPLPPVPDTPPGARPLSQTLDELRNEDRDRS